MANTVTIHIRAAASGVTSTLGALRTQIRSLGTHIFSGISSSTRRAVSFLHGHFSSGLSRVSGLIPGRVRSGFSRATGAIGGFISSMTSRISSGLSSAGSSIASGLGSGLKAAGSNPYVLAGVTGLVGVLAPLLGTLLGGAIVLGVGGALAGIGIMAAAKAKSVQTAFGKMKDTVGKTLSEAAKPLQPVLIHVAKSVGDFAKQAGPMLKGIFKDMAPALQSFFDSLMKGFKAFAPALKPLSKAFDGLIKALGPVFTTLLGNLGKALGDLGKQFQQKDTINAFVGVISALFSLLPVGVKLITFLTQVFTQLWPSLQKVGKSLYDLAVAVGPLFLLLIQGYVKYIQILYPILAIVIEYIAKFITAIINGAKDAVPAIKAIVEWVKKVTGKTIKLAQKGASAVINWVKSIINWVKNVKNKTVALAQRGASAVVNWVKSIINWVRNIKNKTVALAQRGASGVVNWVKNIINTIKRFVGKTVHLGVSGVGAAINAVQSVINRIKNFVGKTISIGVNFFKGAGSKLASALGFAHGGYVGAAASGGPRTNSVLVGEQGPELVDLAPGSRVRSADSTRTILGQTGSQNAVQHFTIVLGDKNLGEFLVDPLKRTIRKRGGNVQRVLGVY